jgi:hypothetical protein
VADETEHPTVESHEHDIANLFEWVDALERRIAIIEAVLAIDGGVSARLGELEESLDTVEVHQ